MVFYILIGATLVGTVYSLMKHTEAVYKQDIESIAYYRRIGLVCSIGMAIFLLMVFSK